METQTNNGFLEAVTNPKLREEIALAHTKAKADMGATDGKTSQKTCEHCHTNPIKWEHSVMQLCEECDEEYRTHLIGGAK